MDNLKSILETYKYLIFDGEWDKNSEYYKNPESVETIFFSSFSLFMKNLNSLKNFNCNKKLNLVVDILEGDRSYYLRPNGFPFQSIIFRRNTFTEKFVLRGRKNIFPVSFVNFDSLELESVENVSIFNTNLKIQTIVNIEPNLEELNFFKINAKNILLLKNQSLLLTNNNIAVFDNFLRPIKILRGSPTICFKNLIFEKEMFTFKKVLLSNMKSSILIEKTHFEIEEIKISGENKDLIINEFPYNLEKFICDTDCSFDDISINATFFPISLKEFVIELENKNILSVYKEWRDRYSKGITEDNGNIHELMEEYESKNSKDIITDSEIMDISRVNGPNFTMRSKNKKRFVHDTKETPFTIIKNNELKKKYENEDDQRTFSRNNDDDYDSDNYEDLTKKLDSDNYESSSSTSSYSEYRSAAASKDP